MVGDLFHVGHLNLIKRAKSLGDYLIVGVHLDKDVESYKRPPIISEEQRVEIIKSCSYVDEVITGAPLIISESFINRHKITKVVHGDEKSPVFLKQHAIPIELGIMHYIPYTDGISTTQIIDKIKTCFK
jgi:cytidyltransferase-like protein